ncbi:MAG: divergent PAP2 family protein [Oscillospiraceae bacterium]|nr:divergent PAP2 family protein [Oscillospiraceae bacterium]
MDGIATLLRNYPLIASGSAWLSAQILKVIIKSLTTRRLEIERLFGAGGMPSAHSATVSALVIATSRVDGLSSTGFALVVIFAFVVMYDAMGVRRAAGEQAKRINMILSKIKSIKENEDDINMPENLKNIEKKEILDNIEAEEEIAQNLINNIDEELLFPDKELKEYIGHTPLEVLSGALLGIIVAMLIRI